MIRDNELIFCTATSPTTTNTCLASNIWNSGPLASSPFTNNGRDLGAGEEAWVEFLITASATSAATASVISFEIVTASASDLTSFTVMATTDAATAGTWTLGARRRLRIPPHATAWRQYVGVNCRITLGVLSALSYSAYVVKAIDTVQAYAPGFKLDA